GVRGGRRAISRRRVGSLAPGPALTGDAEQHGGDGHAIEEAGEPVLGVCSEMRAGVQAHGETADHQRAEAELNEDAWLTEKGAQRHDRLLHWVNEYQSMRASLTTTMVTSTASRFQSHT